MAWTYSGNPASSSRDAVRFLIGDTDTDDQQIQDEEIDYLLGRYTTPSRAAWWSALSIAAKYAKKADKTVGTLSLRYGQKHDQYKELADFLRKQDEGALMGPPWVKEEALGKTYLGGDWRHNLLTKRVVDTNEGTS